MGPLVRCMQAEHANWVSKTRGPVSSHWCFSGEHTENVIIVPTLCYFTKRVCLFYAPEKRHNSHTSQGFLSSPFSVKFRSLFKPLDLATQLTWLQLLCLYRSDLPEIANTSSQICDKTILLLKNADVVSEVSFACPGYGAHSLSFPCEAWATLVVFWPQTG